MCRSSRPTLLIAKSTDRSRLSHLITFSLFPMLSPNDLATLFTCHSRFKISPNYLSGENTPILWTHCAVQLVTNPVKYGKWLSLSVDFIYKFPMGYYVMLNDCCCLYRLLIDWHVVVIVSTLYLVLCFNSLITCIYRLCIDTLLLMLL